MRNEQWKRRYYDGRYEPVDLRLLDQGSLHFRASDEYGIKYEDLRVRDNPRVQKVLGRMGLEGLGIVSLERSPIEPVNLRRELGSVAVYNARNLLSRMRRDESLEMGDFMAVISEDERSATLATDYLTTRGIIDIDRSGESIRNQLHRGVKRDLINEGPDLGVISNIYTIVQSDHYNNTAVQAVDKRIEELLGEIGEGWVPTYNYMYWQSADVAPFYTDKIDMPRTMERLEKHVERGTYGDMFEISKDQEYIRRRPDTLEAADIPATDPLQIQHGKLSSGLGGGLQQVSHNLELPR